MLESLGSRERYRSELKLAADLMRVAKKYGQETGSMDALAAMLGSGIGAAVLPEGNPLLLHYVMFVPTLIGQVIARILQRDEN